MADEVRPIRRVVRETTHVGHAGTAADRAGIHIGRCAVEQNAGPPLYQHMPGMISGARDDGNLPFHFEPPAATCASCSQTASPRIACSVSILPMRISFLRFRTVGTTPHRTVGFPGALSGQFATSCLPFAKAERSGLCRRSQRDD